MPTKITTIGAVPVETTGADVANAGPVTPAAYDQNVANLRAAVDRAQTAANEATAAADAAIAALGGFSASQTPAANQIPVVKADGSIVFPGYLRQSTNSTLSNGAASEFNQHNASSNVMVIYNRNAASPYGLGINFSAAAPNGTGNVFLSLSDLNAARLEVRSNGGIANYSANNVNLSDERTKNVIADMEDYWQKWRAFRFVEFAYKDQPDQTDTNLGLLANELEIIAPELVDNSGFGETPSDGIPLKAIFQTDLLMAMGKVLQEAQVRIEALENK